MQINSLKKVTVISFVCMMIITFISLYSNYIENTLMSMLAAGEKINRIEMKASDFRQQILTFVQIGIFVISIGFLLLMINKYGRINFYKIDRFSATIAFILLIVILILPLISYYITYTARTGYDMLNGNILDIATDITVLIFSTLILLIIRKMNKVSI